MNAYRLIFTYDLIAETQQEYFQFVMGSVLPLMQSKGLEIMDAWSTAYGDGPNRLISFVADEREVIDAFLESEVWEQLREGLDQYVIDFSYKVIPYREGFQF
ncbi:MAG: hypothetical protein M9928_03120 [Anaerolineae bacterium]|nr:hypothetical protein [Anaerolineae bacterium]MCO5186679.1 hypothetical protein [Anaerolineae bacterium]MCO5194424.1 hypothetical protein [Anaerolineae bacterium]MCO5199263.1 hypothetical protein [Anaerolineae bacterium]MCO5203997.1 hypothetical protein [Anaerolineae bacterium]